MSDYFLYNSLDSTSRSFVQSNDLSPYVYVDWYVDQASQDEFISTTKVQGISSFPSFCFSLPATGGLPQSWVVINNPLSTLDATNQREALWQQKGIDGAKLPPIPPPAPVPDLATFELAIFQHPQVSPTAKIMLPLTYGVLGTNIDKPPLVQAYWATLKATSAPQFGLDDASIKAVEGLAIQYNIPLV